MTAEMATKSSSSKITKGPPSQMEPSELDARLFKNKYPPNASKTLLKLKGKVRAFGNYLENGGLDTKAVQETTRATGNRRKSMDGRDTRPLTALNAGIEPQKSREKALPLVPSRTAGPNAAGATPEFHDAKSYLGDQLRPALPSQQSQEGRIVKASGATEGVRNKTQLAPSSEVDIQKEPESFQGGEGVLVDELQRHIHSLQEELSRLRKECQQESDLNHPEEEERTSQQDFQGTNGSNAEHLRKELLDAQNQEENLVEKNNELFAQIDSLESDMKAQKSQYELLSHQLEKSEQELTFSDQELRKYKQLLESRDQDILSLQEEIESHKNSNAALRKKLGVPRSDLEGRADSYALLAQRLAESDKKIQDLTLEVARAKEVGDEAIRERNQAMGEQVRLRSEMNRLVTQVASEKATVDVYYCDDPYFRRQFSNLRASVKDWAICAFSALPTKGARRIPSTLCHSFESVSKYWDLYMGSNEHRPSFVQAYVWAYLLDEVFGGRFWEATSSSLRYGQLLEEYHKPRGNEPEHERIYHEWRCAGARLAAPQGRETYVVETLASPRIVQVVRAMRDPLEMWSTISKTQAFNMLERIIKDAVRLDLQMQQQKASFSLLDTRYLAQYNNRTYDHSMMEVRLGKISSSRQQHVVLLTAPILLKTGDSDGKDYKTSVILEKALVDLEPPKTKGFFSS